MRMHKQRKKHTFEDNGFGSWVKINIKYFRLGIRKVTSSNLLWIFPTLDNTM